LGVKRTSLIRSLMSANDPKRTFHAVRKREQPLMHFVIACLNGETLPSEFP